MPTNYYEAATTIDINANIVAVSVYATDHTV